MKLVRDCAWWLFCWACWRAYTWLPWSLVSGRFGLSILGWAGMYAYSISWAAFRDCVQWHADGMPRDDKAIRDSLDAAFGTEPDHA